MPDNPYPNNSNTFHGYNRSDLATMFDKLVAVLGNATYYGFGLPTVLPYVLLVDLQLYSWYIDLATSKVYNFTNGGWEFIGSISDPTISLIPRTPQALIYNSDTNALSLTSSNTVLLKTEGFIFTQLLPLAVWTIVHGLKKQPTVLVLDKDGNEVFGDINFIDQESLTITFSIPFSGTAYLN